jgi:hypothetical protein
VAQQLANIMMNMTLMPMLTIHMMRTQPTMLTTRTTLMVQTMGLTRARNSSPFR